MNGPRGGTLLDRWLALAAGRLQLRRPDDAGLLRLSARHLPTATPQQLAEGIASGADSLFTALEARPDAEPLARVAGVCPLSGFDLDLLGLAVLPCFDEDAALAIAGLTGGPRRITIGLGISFRLENPNAIGFTKRLIRHSQTLLRLRQNKPINCLHSSIPRRPVITMTSGS